MQPTNQSAEIPKRALWLAEETTKTYLTYRILRVLPSIRSAFGRDLHVANQSERRDTKKSTIIGYRNYWNLPDGTEYQETVALKRSVIGRNLHVANQSELRDTKKSTMIGYRNYRNLPDGTEYWGCCLEKVCSWSKSSCSQLIKTQIYQKERCGWLKKLLKSTWRTEWWKFCSQ